MLAPLREAADATKHEIAALWIAAHGWPEQPLRRRRAIRRPIYAIDSSASKEPFLHDPVGWSGLCFRFLCNPVPMYLRAMPAFKTSPPQLRLRRFLRTEAGGGLLMIFAAVLALIVANGPLGKTYFDVQRINLGPLSLLHWINDGLMTLFFLLIGLELKREFVEGQLSSWRDRRVPLIAGLVGMAVPALVYLLVAGRTPELAKGWAIPAATDIAFAIGVLALLGRRVPLSLKLFLTSVAIVDDMGAVVIIAFVYAHAINGLALLAAGLILAAIFALNRSGVMQLWPYLLLAWALWVAMLMSGIHATIAGVMAAFAIPIIHNSHQTGEVKSPLHQLEQRLHPWVALGILPLFGFANAGVSLAGISLQNILAPLPLGVAAGLFLGKQIGIFAGVRIAVALGLGRRPSGATWLQVYGVALMCGFGFTMSMFIGRLAFSEAGRIDGVKIGVLAGSLLSAAMGLAVLHFASTKR